MFWQAKTTLIPTWLLLTEYFVVPQSLFSFQTNRTEICVQNAREIQLLWRMVFSSCN